MKLVWSNIAKAELDSLRRFSTDRWGRDVALRYLEDLRDGAKCVATDPRRAKPLKGPFYGFRVRSHYLVVRLNEADGTLTVARILHVAMNIDRHL